jgi:hypothetical protein
VQINADTVQFNMQVRGDIPSPVEPGCGITYIWLIDTDQNISTGQPHVFVGSEYNVRVAYFRGIWEGWIDVINWDDPGGGSAPVFVKDRTVSILIKRSQIGGAVTFNWEIDSFSDQSAGDSANSYTTATLSDTSPPAGTIDTIRIYPPHLVLRNGQTIGAVGILVRDRDGAPLSLTGRDILFFSSRPSAATVTDSGEVTGMAYGHSHITAKVDGIMTANMAVITAGEFNLIPPILLLSVNDEPTGTLSINLENADGTPVPLGDKTIEFISSFSQVATVNNDGMVTALRPPQNFGETPYVSVRVNDVYADNAAVTRVTTDTLVHFHKTDLDFSGSLLQRLDPRPVAALSCLFDPPPKVSLHCGLELGYCFKLAVAQYLVLGPVEYRLQGHQPWAPRWQPADDQPW